MARFSSLLLLTCLIACAYISHGEAVKIKTDPKELTPLERLFIRLHHPEIPLPKLEKRDLITEYQGFLELWNIDIPTIFLQLVKFGTDTIRMPNWGYEYGFYYCYMGICIGFLDIYNYRNPVLNNASRTDMKASMNGTVLRLDFNMPDIQIHSPEFTKDSTDLVTNDKQFWRGYSFYLKNYTLGFTGNFTLGPNGLQVEKVQVDFSISEFRDGYHNATHTFPDGTTEEWGPSWRDYLEEGFMEGWEEIKEEVQAAIEIWLNCFLSNGVSGGDKECAVYLDDPLHVQSFAQILHSFGLAGLNHQRG